MEQKKKVKLINFGAELQDSVLLAIEEGHDLEIDQVRIKASLDLKKHSTYLQVHILIERNRDLFYENDFFIVNLPGLPIFSAMLITEIHALTGKFPVILECIKDFSSEGIFSNYKYKRLYDLSRERTQSRENFKNFNVSQ